MAPVRALSNRNPLRRGRWGMTRAVGELIWMKRHGAEIHLAQKGMTMKKGLMIGGGIVVVAVVGIVIFVFSSIDSLIKAAVEEFGSRATKTQVTLDEVEISAISGKGALRGFTMGNPAGFKTASAIRLGEIKIDMDVGSVTEDTVIIREILIVGPEITYELASGGSNLDAIRKNVQDFTGGGKAAPAASGEKEEGGKKLIIENLIIRGGKVNVSATFLKGKTMTVPLPAIHLKDIGKKEGGATPGEVIEMIMAKVTSSASGAVSSLNLGKAMDAAKAGAEGAKKMLESGAGGATDALKKTGDSIGGAIKGLFGK